MSCKQPGVLITAGPVTSLKMVCWELSPAGAERVQFWTCQICVLGRLFVVSPWLQQAVCSPQWCVQGFLSQGLGLCALRMHQQGDAVRPLFSLTQPHDSQKVNDFSTRSYSSGKAGLCMCHPPPEQHSITTRAGRWALHSGYSHHGSVGLTCGPAAGSCLPMKV